MKKTAFLISAVVVLLCQNLVSQRLYFCEEYRDSREINKSDVFIIGPSGGYFTCMIDLRDARKTIGTSKVSLNIYKNLNGNYVKIATEKFDVQSKWDYIFFDKFHTFYAKGDYKVTAVKSNGSTVATGYVTIKNNYDSKLYFCEEYRRGDEIGVSDVFIIGSGGGYFTCMLDLRPAGKTLGTSSVVLKIFKVGSSGEDTERFDVQSDWDYIFFDKFHTFYNPGFYIVKATESDGTPIATGGVLIKKR